MLFAVSGAVAVRPVWQAIVSPVAALCLVTAPFEVAAEPGSTANASTSADAPTPEAKPRVALLPLNVDGELTDSDRELLTRHLADGLARGAFEVESPSEVERCAKPTATCDGPTCFRRVAHQCDARYVVQAHLRTADRNYAVEIDLIDSKTGESVARSDGECEICGIADVARIVDAAGATLRTKIDALAQGAPILRIETSPAGAVVTFDGEPVGRTPMERSATAGKHVVRVTKEGFVAVEREITAVDGVVEQLNFDLEKVPNVLPKRPWGWASLAVGIAGVGASTAFAVLDDRPYRLGHACKGSNVDAEGRCRRLWDTEWIVFGTSLASAALVTLGVAVLLSSKPPRNRSKGRHKAEKRSAHALLQGRF